MASVFGFSHNSPIDRDRHAAYLDATTLAGSALPADA
jgi:hypothetical protein